MESVRQIFRIHFCATSLQSPIFISVFSDLNSMRKAVCIILMISFCGQYGLSRTQPLKDSSKKAPLEVRNLSESDRNLIKAPLSNFLLRESQTRLEEYFANDSKEALSQLAAGWGSEDSAEIRRNLASAKSKVSVEIIENIMLLREGKVVLKLEIQDPYAGRFLINGAPITIQPYYSYRDLVSKINTLMKVSLAPTRKSLFGELFLPDADAQYLSAAAAAAAKAAPVVGGFIARSSKTALVAAGKGAWSFTKWGSLAAGGSTISACIMFGRLFGEWQCIAGTKAFLCEHDLKKDGCIAAASDLAPILEDANAEGLDTVSLPMPVNNDLCKQTSGGDKPTFKKQIQLLDFKTIKASADSAQIPRSIGRKVIDIDYTTAEGPPVTTPVTKFVETIRRRDDAVVGVRTWTFTTNEKFKVEYVDHMSIKPPDTFECDTSDKKPSKACSDVIRQTLGPLKPVLACKPDNAQQVLNDIKSSVNSGKTRSNAPIR